MQTYAHLAHEERYHIELMRKEGVSIRRIAAGMNWSPSTVSQELAHNNGQRGYRHRQAQRKARERLKAKPKCVYTANGDQQRGDSVGLLSRPRPLGPNRGRWLDASHGGGIEAHHGEAVVAHVFATNDGLGVGLCLLGEPAARPWAASC